MTICKKLAEKESNGMNITAWELRDKPHFMPRYEISVFNGDTEYQTYKVAKTTWKKKFKEL